MVSDRSFTFVFTLLSTHVLLAHQAGVVLVFPTEAASLETDTSFAPAVYKDWAAVPYFCVNVYCLTLSWEDCAHLLCCQVSWNHQPEENPIVYICKWSDTTPTYTFELWVFWCPGALPRANGLIFSA